MRKTKLGLSLLAMLAFMLVFSTVVAAAGPANLKAVAGDEQVKLTWSEVTEATEYVIYQDSTEVARVADDGTATSFTYTVTGLTNGTEYSFDVAAVVATVEGDISNVKAKPIVPAPTGLTAVTGDGEVTLSWTNDPDATSYKVYTKAADGKFTVLVATVTENTYTVTGLTNGVSTAFAVEAYEGTVKSAQSTVTSTGLEGQNAIMDNTDTQADGGVDFNANLTGSGVNQQNNKEEVIKSDGMTSTDGTQTQKTHGEYHNNTNSCASCHQTHTAASKSLLFKDGVYNTCSACHDGTLGFYNVFESHSDLGSAGTFGGTDAGNMSVHLANGATKLSAAPGGNLNGSGSWSSEFNCASCHSPHGSYSDRLLHYSPNKMGTQAPDAGGIAVADRPVMDSATFDAKAWTDADNGFYLVRGTKLELGITNADMTDTDKAIVVKEVETVTKYGKTTTTVTDLDTPWLYGYAYAKPKNYYTRFYSDPGADEQLFVDTSGNYPYVIDDHDQEDGTVHFEYDKGYVWASDTSLDNLLSGDVGRAYVVKLDLIPKWEANGAGDANLNGIFDTGEGQKFGDLAITTVNQRALYAGEINSLSTNVEERWGLTPDATTGEFAGVKGWGVAMTDYCASCHTDYMAHSGSESGTWNTAYRHSTDSDSYTCVRCHFAHGTDVTVMRDAQNNTTEELVTAGAFADLATAEAYMIDKNPSSALKRYTNMSVCWACHTSSKAEQLKNTDSYDKTEDPHGLADSEGTFNWPVK